MKILREEQNIIFFLPNYAEVPMMLISINELFGKKTLRIINDSNSFPRLYAQLN